MTRERRLDYVEFASSDPAASRAFFEVVFGWSFVDYGSDYTAFDDGRLQGGFFRGQPQRASEGAPLLVLYADQLAPMEAAVRAAGPDPWPDYFDIRQSITRKLLASVGAS